MEEFQERGRQTKKTKIEEHVQLCQEQVIVEGFDTKNLPTSTGAYRSKNLDESINVRRRSPENDRLIAEEGFRYIAAQDVNDDIKSPRPFSDMNGRIFSCYAGMPGKGDDFKIVCDRLYDYLQAEKEVTEFDDKEIDHKRGKFPAINFGISQGLGKGEATRIKEGKHAGIIQRLRDNADLRRIASFQDSAFKLWSPRLYAEYWETMKGVHSQTQERRNFDKSVFVSATVNFGLDVRTIRHRDMLNLAYGWCAITALGNFDHTLGGHLILWEAKLTVEFPAGSTYLIPSSCLTHSNVPIQPGEKRASFTQYTAGGVFRWVANGYRRDDYLEKHDNRKYLEIMEQRKQNWANGLALYATLGELLEPL